MVCWLDPFKETSRVKKEEVDHITIIPDRFAGIKYEEVNGNLPLCKFTSKVNAPNKQPSSEDTSDD